MANNDCGSIECRPEQPSLVVEQSFGNFSEQPSSTIEKSSLKSYDSVQTCIVQHFYCFVTIALLLLVLFVFVYVSLILKAYYI